jgi:anti-sigma factor RsiW
MLSPYHDGELSGRIRDLAGDHLASCRECSSKLAAIGQIGHALRKSADALASSAPDFTFVVTAEAARRARLRSGSRPDQRFAFQFTFARAAVAAAVLAVVIAAAIVVPGELRDRKDSASDCVVESLEYASGNVVITTVEPARSTVIWVTEADDDEEAG